MANAPDTSIKAYRKELGLTLEAFAAFIGLKSKGQASQIERDGKCSPEVALELERKSGGRIDAAVINKTIAAARERIAA